MFVTYADEDSQPDKESSMMRKRSSSSSSTLEEKSYQAEEVDNVYDMINTNAIYLPGVVDGEGLDTIEQNQLGHYYYHPNRHVIDCQSKGHEIEEGKLSYCTGCTNPVVWTMKEEHLCYCARPAKAKMNKADTYWFFDFETVPLKSSTLGKECHTVVFAVLSNHDGRRVYEFTSIEEFCETVFSNMIFQNGTFISHNGGKFDMQLIFAFLLKQGCMPTFITHHGSPSKLLELIFRKRRFIDSVNFITLPLSAFGKTFGLDSCKGDFPHAFAKQLTAHLPEDGPSSDAVRCLSDYTGLMPDIEFYNLDGVKGVNAEATEKAVASLRKWHTEESVLHGSKWNAMTELIKYCIQDVAVLRMGCMKYREEFANAGFTIASLSLPLDAWQPPNIDPFAYLTQSQVCQALFMLGLDPDFQLAHFPAPIVHGWSHKSLIWLTWMERVLGFRIQHRGNSPHEKRLRRYIAVDGYGKDKEGTAHVLQFNGCYWHGCPICFPNRAELHPHKNETFEEIYKETLNIEFKLKMMNHTKLYTIWEHEFDEQLKQGYYDVVPPEATELIKYRDFIYGGRTEVFYPYYRCVQYERIRYMDVTSLYPTVCVRDPLPTGHPTITLAPNCRLEDVVLRKVFGVVRCSVRCPIELFVPLLPTRRSDGRLIFDLDSPKKGVWTTVDLYYALDNGYEVLQVYEIHHFPPSEISCGLFKGYVDYFLRTKIECDGWPDGCETKNDKDEYAETVFEENGEIGRIRKDQVDKNPGKRFVAKLCLNSLWGKFIQQACDEGFQFVASPQQFRELLLNPTIDMKGLQFMRTSEETLLASYRYKEEFISNAMRYNPYLGAFVTAHARRRLHEAMKLVGFKRILYCDTDSIIYVTRLNSCDAEIPNKPGLGNWASEMEPYDHQWGVEFMSSGPKSYCLVFNQPSADGSTFMMKQKGLTLNHGNSTKLDVGVLRRCIMEHWRSDVSSVLPMLDQFTIRTTLRNGTVLIESVEMKKKFDISITKRTMLKKQEGDENEPHFIVSLPFGYEQFVSSARRDNFPYLQQQEAFTIPTFMIDTEPAWMYDDPFVLSQPHAPAFQDDPEVENELYDWMNFDFLREDLLPALNDDDASSESVDSRSASSSEMSERETVDRGHMVPQEELIPPLPPARPFPSSHTPSYVQDAGDSQIPPVPQESQQDEAPRYGYW